MPELCNYANESQRLANYKFHNEMGQGCRYQPPFHVVDLSLQFLQLEWSASKFGVNPQNGNISFARRKKGNCLSKGKVNQEGKAVEL